MEAMELLQKNCGYIKTNITKATNVKQTTPLMHLTSLCRQLFTHLSKTHGLDIEQIVIPPEIPRICEVFFTPNLTTVLPNERKSTEEYLNNFQEGISDRFMLTFTDGSVQGNPGPTGCAGVIKKQGLKSVPIKK